MSSINGKSLAVVAVAGAALLAGIITFLAQKQKVDLLQAQINDVQTQLEQAKAANQTAQQNLAARDQELHNLLSASTDLARTRNEIAQLRQQRATAASNAPAPANPTARTAAPAAFPPGTYVNRDQLAFAGYATPEATIQSLAWAAVNGQTNIISSAIPTNLPEPQGQQLMEELTQALQGAGPILQGMQITAEKTLGDGQMEVLVKIDSQTPPGGDANGPPPYNIVPMMQVDNEWKIAGSATDYSSVPDWAKTGQIKTFTP
jgi:hypothetical protein